MALRKTRFRLSNIMPPASLLLLGLAFGGCATPSRVPLSKDPQVQTRKTEAIIVQSQQEIAADIVESNIAASTGGGLIPALIDMGINNSRAKKAVSAASPVRDSLIGYDTGRTLADALSAELPAQTWMEIDRVDVRPLADRATTESWLASNTSSGLLTVFPYYRLTAKFDAIMVHARVQLNGPAPKRRASATTDDEESIPKPPLWYSNTFAVVVPITGYYTTTMSNLDAANLWASDGGMKAREALDTGFREIARMLAYDLGQEAPLKNGLYKAPEGTTKQIVPAVGRLFINGNEGYVVHSPETRSWLRMPGGELVSVPR